MFLPFYGFLVSKSLCFSGDQILDVNGQNFEKLLLERAQALLKKNTNLSMTLKTNLFGKYTKSTTMQYLLMICYNKVSTR